MADSNLSSSPSWLQQASAAHGVLLAADPISIVDVGAAGAPPPNQACLASVSTYLGFDPDLRAPQTGNAFGFLKHSVLNRAITARDQDRVTFNLTRFPECSSVLSPDRDETRRYAIGEFFDIVGQTSAPAITLEAAVAQVGLPQIDWLKLDTQGTDYEILTSLSPARFDRLLVVDAEPGVTAFYHGENTLADLHGHMLRHGFWLANLSQQRFPRLAVKTIEALGLAAVDVALLDRSPFALELQYCRTIEFMEAHAFAPRDYLCLWLIAMANGRTAYAIEVAAAAQRHGLSPDGSQQLVAITLAHCRAAAAGNSQGAVSRFTELIMPPILPRACRRVLRWCR